MLKTFSLLFLFVIVSSCSSEVMDEDRDYSKMIIEDHDEITGILEKAQAAEKEINSIVITAETSQEMTIDEVNEKTVMNVTSSIILDPIAGVINTEMELLGETADLRMYLSEDATYLSNNPNDDDESWEKLTDRDHEEIIADYNDEFSLVNYDVLLEHVDELALHEVDNYVRDIKYYSLEWRGDSQKNYELLTQQNPDDETDGTATVEEFVLTLEIEKDTGHPMTIMTWMNGTRDMEGEEINIVETIGTSIYDINVLEDGDLVIPEHVEQFAETNE